MDNSYAHYLKILYTLFRLVFLIQTSLEALFIMLACDFQILDQLVVHQVSFQAGQNPYNSKGQFLAVKDFKKFL